MTRECAIWRTHHRRANGYTIRGTQTMPTDEFEEQFAKPVDNTVLGLSLDVEIKDLGVPLDAFVIVKSYIDGEPAYRITSTENLTSVECLGMLEWAKNVLVNTMFIAGLVDSDDDSDDDD